MSAQDRMDDFAWDMTKPGKDEETARKDREFATCERLLRESYDENARLRAELGHERGRYESGANAYQSLRATLERVRAVLDSEEIDGNGWAVVRSAAVRTALEGEQQ